jgi:hypothetical protein
MVLSFFKKDSAPGLDHVVTKSVSMLGDARHSFDLATLALLTKTDPESVASDIRETDDRINRAEQDLRSELVVHVSVHGTSDIGSVLGLTLLLKKIERIGDQAKNILDLSETGITLSEHRDAGLMAEERQVVSALFGEAAELLGDLDASVEAIEEFTERASAIGAGHQAKIDGFMTSDLPGREVVPLAIYYRYLKRIVANLVGIVRIAVEPILQVDYLDEGATDTDD